MEDLYLKLCHVDDYHFVNLNNISDGSKNTSIANVISGDSDNYGAGSGTSIGVCVAFLINAFITIKTKRLGSKKLNAMLSELIGPKTLIIRTVAIVILLLLLPLVLIVLMTAFLYKVLCSIIIRRKDKHFVGYLDSFDVFWSLEDDASKSIINVLGIIESDSAFELAKNIKDKLENILPSLASEKMFYRKNEEFGLYYWRKFNDIDMDEYVQIYDHPCKNKLNLVDLQDILRDVSKKALPYADEGLFQILITKQKIHKENYEKGEYGIIFRIHHSVGDGVALMEFLCKTLADENDSFLKMFPNSSHRNCSSPAGLTSMMRKLCEIPLCFVDGILRQSDDNALHGPSLSGKKIFAWTDSDDNLFQSVRNIKNSMEGWRFSDILGAALAHGLHNFFSKVTIHRHWDYLKLKTRLLSEQNALNIKQTMINIPEHVAVVLPVRFPKATTHDADFKLENDFSVTIMDLPTRDYNDVNNIKLRFEEMRRSADPLTNYLFLKLVAGVLPKQILEPLLNSSQATMVLSNMPGPARLKFCGGNILKDLVFFVPNKGNTGLGITALCYGGVLRFGAMADAALVSSSEELAVILRGMVEEVYRLHDLYGDRQSLPKLNYTISILLLTYLQIVQNFATTF